jgi:hypothetical protein
MAIPYPGRRGRMGLVAAPHCRRRGWRLWIRRSRTLIGCRRRASTTVLVRRSRTALEQPWLLNSERWDTDTCHDTVTNNSRLTAKTAGVYSIIGISEWDANATGIRGLELWVNNTTPVGADYRPAEALNSIVQSAAAQWLFAVNDYVEIKVQQDSGASRTLGAGAITFSEF